MISRKFIKRNRRYIISGAAALAGIGVAYAAQKKNNPQARPIIWPQVAAAAAALGTTIILDQNLPQ